MPRSLAIFDPTATTPLERHEVVYHPMCSLALPPEADLEFLRTLSPWGPSKKDLSYDPVGDRFGGRRPAAPTDRRLGDIFRRFSQAAVDWLGQEFPNYCDGLVPDRVTLRTEEEANRPLRYTARNDLLHIDQFPTRPSRGRRILRLYVNLNPVEPQVWAMSEAFPPLLARYRAVHRVPARDLAGWLAPSRHVGRWLLRGGPNPTLYDDWMLRLHHFLKFDDPFQGQAARRVWSFPPGSMWAFFADGLAHAQLRGRLTLEHSFFIPTECLAVPESAPIAQLTQAGLKACA